MSKVLAKVKDYAITEEMLNETVEALRTQQHINITSEEQKQDLLDELIARQLVVEDAIESGLTQTEEFQKLYREFVFQHSIGQMFKTINVTDEECEAYYNENKEHQDCRVGAQILDEIINKIEYGGNDISLIENICY
jgi:peptidyl-prolyl cis-trans isomerase C